MTTRPIAPPLARALAERSYTDLTEVQNSVLADEAQGRDLLVSAQTGSGKTVAFGLALAPTLLGEAEEFPPARSPLALIVAPTRELALQVQSELHWLYQHTGARIVACVGGMDPRREKRRLEEGAHIVVGTPGRLRDHITRAALRLDELRAVVLDEADEMLDLGFREDLEFILEAAPAERRSLLFSATLPRGIVTLAGRYQHDALRIAASGPTRSHADIEYRFMRIAPEDTAKAVVNTLRYVDAPCSIVFCNTREAVRRLHGSLAERGFSAVFLSGELGQHERNHALQALRDGRARICVATDVAARGIDLPNLGLVIHAELPNDAEILQHRSGRTGRAGRKGISVLIVPPNRRRKAEQLLADARIEAAKVVPPTADEIRTLDRERLLNDPLFAEESGDDDRAMSALLMETLAAEDIALTLARVIRSRLPEPEDLAEVFAERPAAATRDGKTSRAERKRSNEDEGGDTRPGRAEPQGPMVWFRVEVGRRNRADPKWLLPLLCRRGQITRDDIGAIRIFDEVTDVEIAESVAEAFINNARKGNSDDTTILPRTDGAQPGEARAHKPKRADRYEDRPVRDRPDRERPARDAKPFRKGPPRGERSDFERPSRPPRPERDEVADAPRPARFDPRDSDGLDEAPAQLYRGGKPVRRERGPAGEDFGSKPFGKKPFGKKPFGARGDDKPGFGKKPFGKKPFGAKSSADRDGDKPFRGKPGGFKSGGFKSGGPKGGGFKARKDRG